MIFQIDLYGHLKQKLDNSIYIQKKISSQNIILLQKEAGRLLNKKPNSRKHLVKNLSIASQARRKRARMEHIQKALKADPEFLFYIAWMKDIQTKLNLSNYRFARRLGLANERMLSYYYTLRCFPSENVHKRLVILEKRTRIKVVDIRDQTNIKNKGVTRNFKVPRRLVNASI